MDNSKRNNERVSLPIFKKILNRLEQLRKIHHFKTYDDLINYLINKAESIHKSMYGIDKGRLKSFSKQDRIAFRGY